MTTRSLSVRAFSLSLLAAVLSGAGLLSAASQAGESPGPDTPRPTREVSRQVDIYAKGYLSWPEFQVEQHYARVYEDAGSERASRPAADAFPELRKSEPRMPFTAFLNDLWLTAKVKTVLLKEDLRAGLAIDVTSERGNVLLHGQIDHPSQAAKAIRIASRVDGVKALHAQIRIKA